MTEKCACCSYPQNPRHYRAEMPGIGSLEFKLVSPLDDQSMEFTRRFFALVVDSMMRQTQEWKAAQSPREGKEGG